MHELAQDAIVVLFLVWIVYGVMTSRKNQVEHRQGRPFSYWLHVVAMVFAYVSNLYSLDGWLGTQIFPPVFPLELVGCLLVIMGVCLAIVSRIHLGRQWSAQVQLRQDHKVIKTGPYRLLRHPIYTGIFLTVIGLFLMNGRWLGLLGVLVLVVAYYFKIAAEERLLLTHFGEEYRDYMKKTYRLIPWVY
jgi:protein-S-isoprenylcysteine O-methyltransferase Ste14